MTERKLEHSPDSAADVKIPQIEPKISQTAADTLAIESIEKSEETGTTGKLEIPENDAISILSTKESKVNFGFLPVPRNCRVSETKPFKFNLTINILFGLASTFTVCLKSIQLTQGCQFIL